MLKKSAAEVLAANPKDPAAQMFNGLFNGGWPMQMSDQDMAGFAGRVISGTDKNQNMIEVTAVLMCDVGVRHAASFSKSDAVLTT